MRRRRRSSRIAMPLKVREGPAAANRSASNGRASGVGAASATRATSAPPAASSRATWRLRGPEPHTAILRPGSVR